ncbi:Asg1-like protein [Cladobotryum mycophilum]|uniref:Asg1-like protein n=1 Tax=Cladobotryum mycophilum TaxID=491253 RepID=A0ABR0S4J8_9HYPO
MTYYPRAAEAEAPAAAASAAAATAETDEAQAQAQAQAQTQSQAQTQAAAQTENDDGGSGARPPALTSNVNVEAFYRNHTLPSEQPWLAPAPAASFAPIHHQHQQNDRVAYNNFPSEWQSSHDHYHHQQNDNHLPLPQPPLPPPHTRYPPYGTNWQTTQTVAGEEQSQLPFAAAHSSLPIRERHQTILSPAASTPGPEPVLLSGISRVPRSSVAPASNTTTSTGVYPSIPTPSTPGATSTTYNSPRLPPPQSAANTSSTFNPTLNPTFNPNFNPFFISYDQSSLTPPTATSTAVATSSSTLGPLLAPAPPNNSTPDWLLPPYARKPRQYRRVKALRKPGMYTQQGSNKRAADASSDNDGDMSGGGGGGGASSYPEYDGKSKIARTSNDPMSFSSVVKGRQQLHTRTGQACDRCKVRKIRCDASPDGCSHCVTINAECLVTDRVSGRTERRGYLKELEREKEALENLVQDMENLLRDKGILVKPWRNSTWMNHHPETLADENDNPIPMNTPPRDADWTRYGSLWIKDDPSSISSTGTNSPLLNFSRPDLESRPQEKHIGVGEDKAPVNSIRGTVLSVLGMTINTAAFAAPDIDEPPEDAQISAPLYNKSLQSFLHSSMKNPNVEVSLPTRDNAFTWAGWYFGAVSIFIPLIHKPTFMRLLTRIYDEQGFKPSTPELVIAHMIFATILFQYGARNPQDAEGRRRWNDMSNKHYHFAISKLYDLLGSRDFMSVQALAMIACHTRSFPKPSCVSLVSNLALQRAIDLNLHRSSRKPGQGTNLENEMRKRTWWVILMIVVAVTGRRGSPIPITVEEFDTEFPEPIADELLTDEGVDTSRIVLCPFWAGLAGIKITPVFMQMYSSIYSVRREPANYSRVVQSLERQLREWKDALPASLKLPDLGDLDQTSVPALYIKTFELELRLCLRHPYVAMTGDQRMIDENYRISVTSAREYLKCVQKLSKLKSLDTTWYQMSIYAACIFSTLVASWVKRFETTPEEIVALREEMNSWKAILQETGILMGAGPGISTEIEGVIAHTINRIELDMRSARAKEAVKQEDPKQSQVYQVPQRTHNAAANTTTRSESNSQGQSNTGASAYQADTPMFYNTTQQTGGTTVDAIAGGSTTAPMATFSAQAAPLPTTNMWSDRPNTWQEWATVMTHDQNRYGTGPLMDIQRLPVHTQPLTGSPGGSGEMGTVLHPAAQTSWPHLVFDGAASNT